MTAPGNPQEPTESGPAERPQETPAATRPDASATAPNFPPPTSQTAAFAVTIGDIGVTTDLIVTPNGNAPLAGSRWIVLDQSRTERKIPTWAIVLAIIFALACLLGLLFLLVKEDRTTGYVEVSVMSGSLNHVTQIPIRNEGEIAQVRQRVHQAQTLAAAAQG